MNPNEDLILGFAHPLKPQKKSKLNPENFPSKIGGSPIWLTPSNLPSPLCDQCKNPLKFLLQVHFFKEILFLKKKIRYTHLWITFKPITVQFMCFFAM